MTSTNPSELQKKLETGERKGWIHRTGAILYFPLHSNISALLIQVVITVILLLRRSREQKLSVLMGELKFTPTNSRYRFCHRKGEEGKKDRDRMKEGEDSHFRDRRLAHTTLKTAGYYNYI